MSAGGIVVPESETSTTPLAQKEAADIADGTLRRSEAVATHIHRAGLCIIWVMVVMGTSLALIWAWHLGAPEKWRFLTVEQLSDLQKTLLAAVGSSTATNLGKRWIGDKPKP